MDPLSGAIREVTGALDRLGIRYAIGGSLASSARGIWRATMDVDAVAAILPGHVEDFLLALGRDWYADAETMREAVTAGRPFNIIHMRHVMKVDVFLAQESFHQSQLGRATILSIGDERIPCNVTTAEDILLSKLRWYADGGQAPNSPWSDITTLLAANPSIDNAYLNLWAARLGATALLERARLESAGAEEWARIH